MKRLAIGAVFILSLAAAACGGGGSASKALTKEEYVSKLNQICKDANAEEEKIGTPSGLAEFASKAPKLRAVFDSAVAKAEKLQAPSETKADADKFIADAKRIGALLTEAVDAAKKNDEAKVIATGAKLQAVVQDGEAVGKRLGAPACAQG